MLNIKFCVAFFALFSVAFGALGNDLNEENFRNLKNVADESAELDVKNEVTNDEENDFYFGGGKQV